LDVKKECETAGKLASDWAGVWVCLKVVMKVGVKEIGSVATTAVSKEPSMEAE